MVDDKVEEFLDGDWITITKRVQKYGLGGLCVFLDLNVRDLLDIKAGDYVEVKICKRRAG